MSFLLNSGASVSAELDAALADLSTSFTLSGDGVDQFSHDGTVYWSFALDNAYTQYLGRGDEITALYEIEIADDSQFIYDSDASYCAAWGCV